MNAYEFSNSNLGVGGIEAEAVMLGQAISMVLPQVVGYKLTGELHPLVTSTDVVLTITKVRHNLYTDLLYLYNKLLCLKIEREINKHLCNVTC